MKIGLMVAAAAASVGFMAIACGGGAAISVQGSGGSGLGTGGAGGGLLPSSNGAGGLTIDGGGNPDAPISHVDGCGSVAIHSETTRGNIVVVFDQSDSMSDPYMSASGAVSGPKYKVAADALVAALTPQQANLNVGAIFFPTKGTGTLCSQVDPIAKTPQIGIEGGASFVQSFQAHFSAPGWGLILGTPTVLALEQADAALPDPSPLKGKRAVVILTDGAPTCNTSPVSILLPVKAMASRGIKTYAIGLPGSAKAASLLDAIALEGGTGTYLSPADPAALQAALADITTSTIDQCTIALSPRPPNPADVYLIATDPAHPKGTVIPRVSSGDGWTLSADGTTATLNGAVCSAAKAGDYSALQFVYGCPVLPT